jgi:hypothetical protein
MPNGHQKTRAVYIVSHICGASWPRCVTNCNRSAVAWQQRFHLIWHWSVSISAIYSCHPSDIWPTLASTWIAYMYRRRSCLSLSLDKNPKLGSSSSFISLSTNSPWHSSTLEAADSCRPSSVIALLSRPQTPAVPRPWYFPCLYHALPDLTLAGPASLASRPLAKLLSTDPRSSHRGPV